MTSVATLFEYQKYPFILSNVDSFEEGTLFLTDKTLELLEELNVKGRFLEIGRKTIKPLNQVGVSK